MRIAILAVMLLLLLSPSLHLSAAGPIATPLRPTPSYPQASGTVQIEIADGRAALTFDLHGLSASGGAPSVTGRSAPVYVVWLADASRHLYNLGALPVDSAGNVASTLTPFVVPAAGGVIAVSAEPRADLAAPTAPQETVVLSGPVAGSLAPATNHFAPDFGPDWFVPIIPATLGLTLLRHAARARRAELRARRPAEPLAGASPA
jgi:hypothetical protein